MKNNIHPEQAAYQFAEKAMESLVKWPYWVEQNIDADIRCSRPEMVDNEMRIGMWLYENNMAKCCVGYVSFAHSKGDFMTFTINKCKP